MNEELDENGSHFDKHHAGVLIAQPLSDSLISPTCATCAGNHTASHEACCLDCMFLEGNVAKNRHLNLGPISLLYTARIAHDRSDSLHLP